MNHSLLVAAIKEKEQKIQRLRKMDFELRSQVDKLTEEGEGEKAEDFIKKSEEVLSHTNSHTHTHIHTHTTARRSAHLAHSLTHSRFSYPLSSSPSPRLTLSPLFHSDAGCPLQPPQYRLLLPHQLVRFAICHF